MIETAEDLADPNNAAAAYMKLQDDVKKLIVDTMKEALRQYDTELTNVVVNAVTTNYQFELKVKDVIRNQMSK